jgi:hypothetical protein
VRGAATASRREPLPQRRRAAQLRAAPGRRDGLAIVYAGLVPILERNLVDSKIDQLVPLGENLAVDVPPDPRWQIFVEEAPRA